VTLPIEVSGEGIEARHLESGPESGKDALLFLFNHGGAAARPDVAFRRPAGDYDAMDLVEGRPVALTRTADGIRMNVELQPGAVRVMRITRK
jgi:hypothetical protein